MAIIDKHKTVDEIPEGMEVVGTKVLCPKHGDVSYALTKIPYTVMSKGSTVPEAYEHFFCTQCMAEYFDSLVAEGKFGKLTLERQIADKETAEKIRQKQAEELRSMQEKFDTSEDISGESSE